MALGALTPAFEGVARKDDEKDSDEAENQTEIVPAPENDDDDGEVSLDPEQERDYARWRDIAEVYWELTKPLEIYTSSQRINTAELQFGRVRETRDGSQE